MKLDEVEDCDMKRQSRRRLLGAGLALVLVVGFAPTSGRAGVLDRILRRASGIADNVPVRQLDDAADAARHAPIGRKILAAEGALDSTSRLRVGRRLVREMLEGADSSLLRRVDQLDGPLLEASVVVAKGSRQAAKEIPDLAARGRFLREVDPDTLAALGRYDGLAKDAVRFESATRAGKLLPAPGRASFDLQDFGRFFANEGDRGRTFWGKYVAPHWQLWLGGSALAVVMATPDEYLDDTGDLTRKGIEKLRRIMGRTIETIVEETVKAVGTMTKSPIRGLARGIRSTFLGDAWGVATLTLVGIAGLLAIRPIRRALSDSLARRIQGRAAEGPRRELEP